MRNEQASEGAFSEVKHTPMAYFKRQNIIDKNLCCCFMEKGVK
jgi:hypothetical protein